MKFEISSFLDSISCSVKNAVGNMREKWEIEKDLLKHMKVDLPSSTNFDEE